MSWWPKTSKPKGGADALRALQSLKLTGKMLVQQGQIELAYNQAKKQPGEVRTEITLQRMTMVQAYDGKDGWKIWPFTRANLWLCRQFRRLSSVLADKSRNCHSDLNTPPLLLKSSL
jgi:hypothetical protein